MSVINFLINEVFVQAPIFLGLLRLRACSFKGEQLGMSWKARSR